MDRFREFWAVHGENRLLVVGYVSFLLVLMIWSAKRRSLNGTWAHWAAFLGYSCWTFRGLLFDGAGGSSLVFLFFGACLLVAHGALLAFIWWRGAKGVKKTTASA